MPACRGTSTSAVSLGVSHGVIRILLQVFQYFRRIGPERIWTPSPPRHKRFSMGARSSFHAASRRIGFPDLYATRKGLTLTLMIAPGILQTELVEDLGRVHVESGALPQCATRSISMCPGAGSCQSVEGADQNTSTNGRLSAAPLLGPTCTPRSTECTIGCRCAHCENLGAYECIELQVAVLLESGHQDGQQRLQALAAQPVRRFPQDDQRRLRRLHRKVAVDPAFAYEDQTPPRRVCEWQTWGGNRSLQ